MYKLALEKFENQMGWYIDIHEYIFATYQSPYLFAGLLAATSPQMSVKRSWDITIELYNQFIEGKTPNYRYYGLLPSHSININRLVNGQEIRGPKVRAFFSNLIGDYDAVTIDTWMTKFYRFDGWLTIRRYEKLADRMRNYAKKIGMRPAALQAVCWSWIRDQNGLSHTSYLKQALTLES